MRIYKCILVIIVFVLSLSNSNAQKNVSIGILTDLEKSNIVSPDVNKSLIEEIQKVTGSLYNIKLSEADVLKSNLDLDITTLNYKKLSERCDIILLIGGLSVKGALQEKTFTKPTIAIGTFSIFLQNLPYFSNNTSGRNACKYSKAKRALY